MLQHEFHQKNQKNKNKNKKHILKQLLEDWGLHEYLGRDFKRLSYDGRIMELLVSALIKRTSGVRNDAHFTTHLAWHLDD